MTSLDGFGRPVRALVIGGSGGIGGALTTALCDSPGVSDVFATARDPQRIPDLAQKARRLTIDLDDAAHLDDLAGEIGVLDLVIVATGGLHTSRYKPEKSWRSIDPEAMHWAFHTNAVLPAIAAKHFLPSLRTDRKSVFAVLSARVGSIGDNRLGGWYAYRAAKAALNQIVKSLSIELSRKSREALVVGLHPGTVDTPLSKPFQRGVPEGRLFSPAFSAERLLTVINDLAPADSGGCFAWDGSRIPP